jgi:hypothetical protein
MNAQYKVTPASVPSKAAKAAAPPAKMIVRSRWESARADIHHALAASALVKGNPVRNPMSHPIANPPTPGPTTCKAENTPMNSPYNGSLACIL